jgi:hypothetical protein
MIKESMVKNLRYEVIERRMHVVGAKLNDITKRMAHHSNGITLIIRKVFGQCQRKP